MKYYIALDRLCDRTLSGVKAKMKVEVKQNAS